LENAQHSPIDCDYSLLSIPIKLFGENRALRGEKQKAKSVHNHFQQFANNQIRGAVAQNVSPR